VGRECGVQRILLVWCCILQVSRAGRKRAPTMKALEAEQAPKRGPGGPRGGEEIGGRGGTRAQK
jgi:hypothetical protein